MRHNTPAVLMACIATILFAVQMTGVRAAPLVAEGAAEPSVCRELVLNGGFETPDGSGQGAENWIQQSRHGYQLVDPFYPHPPSLRGVWLGSDDDALDWVGQPITLPPDADSINLTFWWALFTEENPGTESDFLRAQLIRGDGVTVVTTTVTISNDSAPVWSWNAASADLLPYRGQALQLRFVGATDELLPTHFFVDDVRVQACTGNLATETPTVTPTASRSPTASPSPTATATATFTLTPSPSGEVQRRMRLPLILH